MDAYQRGYAPGIVGVTGTKIGEATIGRDWIYNSSDGGVIWGDIANSSKAADGSRVAFVDGQETIIEDSDANSDDIWYAPNTVVMDAQHHDVLKFYGLTLTGGNAEGGIAGLAGLGAVGGAIGMANWAHSLDKNGKYDWTKSVYFDHLLPWMTYVFAPNADGGLDMYITDQFDQLARAIGLEPSADQQQAQDLARQGIQQGWMKIENVDVVGSYLGHQQGSLAGEGTFNMVFKAVNPTRAANDDECARDAREAA